METSWREALRGSRTIPHVSWMARGRWSPRVITLFPLVGGLWLFGTGEALLVESRLGNTPWVVLSEGVSNKTGITIGVATFLVSLIVLLLWIPFRQRPGLGTIANIVIIATAIDVMSAVIPQPSHFAAQLALVLLGITAVGIGSGFYLTAGLGPGPRDGWMTAIHHRFDIPIGRVRLGIEVSVLILGVLLGGRAGLGTALFALLIGRAIALALAAVDRLNTALCSPSAAVAD